MDMDMEPPLKSPQTMKQVVDKDSIEFQRMLWDATCDTIYGLVNKVSVTNVKNIAYQLVNENLIRGRGIFCRACLKLVLSCPTLSNVVAALVAIVNSTIPEIGDVLVRRLVVLFRVAYARKQKPQLVVLTKFIAHLVNQRVVLGVTALELVMLLLKNDDNVELAVVFVKDCGALLQEFSPQGLNIIFGRLGGLLLKGAIDKRVQFMIQGLFFIRRRDFQGYPAIRPELDLLDQEDKVSHEIDLKSKKIDPESDLDVFKPDPEFWTNERHYEELKKEILGGEESFEDEAVSDAASGNQDDDDNDEEIGEEKAKIIDYAMTNLFNLRSMLVSSASFEEASHRLLGIKVEPGQEMELCYMLIECCCQERTFNPLYARLGQMFCMINKVYKEKFERCFIDQHTKVHWLETNHLSNVAKFFAHLLATDALPWQVMAYIRLTEENTASSSRMFIMVLFQELAEQLGFGSLKERLSDPKLQDSFGSIFPKDTPKNIRFSINFFTAIGLGGIADGLRDYLKKMPELIMNKQELVLESEDGAHVGDHKRQRRC